MASTASLEGVKKAVFFPFKGKSWGMKMLIGSALVFANYIIPIVSIIPLFGYYGRIMKRVINENEDPELPEWNDWGELFSEGIKIFGVTFLYTLPGLLMMVAGFVLMFAMNFAFMFDPSNYTAYSPYQTPDMGLIFGSMIGMFGGMLVIMVGMLVTLVASLFLPPALGHMISKGEFGAAFRVKEWWPAFKANFSGYLLALGILYGVYFILFIPVYFLYISVVLCFLMPLAMVVTSFVLGAVACSLYAVAYRDATRKLAAQ
ncbi:MAG: DUF4013 domain-containing protein [Anaerolineales bacterium]|nr:DUF4013 domain-containing protein [Anaerolineales bacterium]